MPISPSGPILTNNKSPIQSNHNYWKPSESREPSPEPESEELNIQDSVAFLHQSIVQDSKNRQSYRQSTKKQSKMNKKLKQEIKNSEIYFEDRGNGPNKGTISPKCLTFFSFTTAQGD